MFGDEASTVVGYALFFPTFSTFKTRRCLHLEDLYVASRARGKGHGKALLGAVPRIGLEPGVRLKPIEVVAGFEVDNAAMWFKPVEPDLAGNRAVLRADNPLGHTIGK